MSPINVAFVTACTALVAALIGPVITFKIGKAQINAAVLSTNRQKWIDSFRDLISAFCSQAVAASLMREKMIDDGRIVVGLDVDLLRRIEEITKTFTKIRLMINPNESDHQSLIALLASTMKILRTAPLNTDLEDDMQKSVDDLVMLTQLILKREWLRVKSGN